MGKYNKGFSDKGFGNSGYGDSGYGAPSYGRSAPTTVKATVKWFNAEKGFGFVTPDDGQSDAFIHMSVLRLSGHSELPEGTIITCEIQQGAKGREVGYISEIVELGTGRPARSGGDRSGGFERGNHDRFGGGNRGGRGGYAAGPESEELEGTVKWFNSQKGFGFIMPDDGSKDVFVHIKSLERSGIRGLDEQQRVRFRTEDSQKGKQVSSIELI